MTLSSRITEIAEELHEINRGNKNWNNRIQQDFIFNIVCFNNTEGFRIYHQFIIPPYSSSKSYRAIISSNSFFHGSKKYNCKKDGTIFKKMDIESDGVYQANDRNNIWIGPYLIFQHETIWDFYNFIGWNWKKKKWNS